MTVPTTIANGATHTGDVRIGAYSYDSRVIFVGDSRVAGLHCTTTYDDYLTLHNFAGSAVTKVNRAWQSVQVRYSLGLIDSATCYQEQVLNAMSYYAPLNIVVVGPFGINDFVNGVSIADICTYNENLCKIFQNLGCKVVFIPEVSAVSTCGGYTGDDLKNQMRAWAIAGGAGSEHWRTFADAFVDVGGFPPFGQDASGAYGPSALGCHNSTCYYTDEVHWTNAGNSTLAANVQPVINNLIDALNTAGYVKPKLPTFIDLLARVTAAEARLTAGGL